MRELTAEMVVDSVFAHQTWISPDGALVAFVVSPVGQAEEHPVSAIWIAPADGASPAMKLTAGTAQDHSPRWSPSGDALFFLSDRLKRGTLQLYRILIAGGEAEVLTDWEPGIERATPLPGGASVAFLAVDVETAEEKKRKEKRDDADVYGERWPTRRLRVVDLESRTVSTVDALGDLHVDEIVPSPDGSRIAVIAWPNPEIDNWYWRAEIQMVDVPDLTSRHVSTPRAGGWNLVWGPSGKRLFFLAHKAPYSRGGVAVFSVSKEGSEPEQVAGDLPACPVELVASREGVLFVLMAEALDSWIGRLDVASGHIERLMDLAGDAWAFDVSADGAAFSVTRSLPDELANVWVGTGDADPRRISDLNPRLGSVAWGRQERLSWQAPDELSIDGLLILPAGAGRDDGPFPLVTLVHGGPYGRWEDSFQLDWMRWGQWLATAGYAVLLPNPRGGLGHGHDFADRVAGAVGVDDWGDVEAGIDHLVTLGIADPARLAIGGWSQGGFMTAWAVGQSDRFKAGIMGAGVSDWGLMAATSDLPHFEMMLGGSSGWEGLGPHRHDALSPISFAGRVTTPVLVLHGEDDARVPPSQGRFFAQALREHNVPVELVTYPREGHTIRERNHQLDLLRRVRSWIERWLGPGHVGAAAAPTAIESSE